MQRKNRIIADLISAIKILHPAKGCWTTPEPVDAETIEAIVNEAEGELKNG